MNGDQRELLHLAQQGDEKAKEAMVKANLGLVWSIVHRYGSRGYEKEDLFQVGSIGLLKAIDRFDESFDVKFSTYAVPVINGEIRRFLRDDGMIRISRSIKENYGKIMQARQKEQDLTISQLSAVTGIAEEDILLALEAPMEVESLFKPAGGEDGAVTIGERIRAPEDEKEQAENRILIRAGLSALEPGERQLIHMRFYEEYSQSAVGRSLGMSQVQVSRLERKILKQLREELFPEKKICE